VESRDRRLKTIRSEANEVKKKMGVSRERLTKSGRLEVVVLLVLAC
jgi:hypothetical protein